VAADQLALSFYRSFELPIVVVRPFNTYGPRQSARAVIPTIITQIARGGRTIQLGATTPTRDFSYVKDTVGGFIATLQSSKGLGQTVNFGSNFEVSIGDAVRLIAEVMGTSVEIVNDEDRLRPCQSEVERLWADNAKAKALFQWAPSYAGLQGFRRGLTETVEWFSDERNLRKYKHWDYNI
jgi:nucleoside-diphosphate-sugar epimerase